MGYAIEGTFYAKLMLTMLTMCEGHMQYLKYKACFMDYSRYQQQFLWMPPFGCLWPFPTLEVKQWQGETQMHQHCTSEIVEEDGTEQHNRERGICQFYRLNHQW